MRDSSPNVCVYATARAFSAKKRKIFVFLKIILFSFSFSLSFNSNDSPVLIIHLRVLIIFILDSVELLAGSVSARETVVPDMNISQLLSFHLSLSHLAHDNRSNYTLSQPPSHSSSFLTKMSGHPMEARILLSPFKVRKSKTLYLHHPIQNRQLNALRFPFYST